MKFKTAEIVEMLDEDSERIVADQYVEARRWESVHRVIFKHDGKLFSVHIRRPLTECQETENCGLYGEYQECHEVEAYEKTVTDYRTLPEPPK